MTLMLDMVIGNNIFNILSEGAFNEIYSSDVFIFNSIRFKLALVHL